MAQRPVAGKRSGARFVLTLCWLALLLFLAGCASPRGFGEVLRSGDSGIAGNWVVVQRGDTLGAIANRANVPLARLQRFNPGVDARRLRVGQRLLVPTQQERAPSGGPYRYQVRPGDTYSAIARRFNTNSSRIQAANPGVQPTALRVGQLIQVPVSAAGGGRAASSSSTSGSSQASSPPARASLRNPGDLPRSARHWPWPLEDYP